MKLNKFRVLEYMDKQGIKHQYELAAQIGVTRQALGQWMKGESSPSLETLAKMCEILDCTPNDILKLPKDEAQAPRQFLPVIPNMIETHAIEMMPV